MERSTPSPLAAPRPDGGLEALAAACDIAVLRALELIGKRVARVDRVRYGAMKRSGVEWHDAHTVWRPEASHVDAALSGAWQVLPRLLSQHGCCGYVDARLKALLDGYVRELAYAQRPHEFEDLRRRLEDAVAA